MSRHRIGKIHNVLRADGNRNRLRPKARPSSSMIDALEPRRLLAVFDGTSAADTIIMFITGPTIHVVINLTDHTTTDTTIVINAGGGNDTVNLNDVPLGLTLNLGDGNDLVRYGADDRIVGSSPNNATVNGGTGTDRVTFDDRNNSTSFERYQVTPNSFYGQILSGVEAGELTPREAGVPITDITGTAGLSTLSIHGGVDFGNSMAVNAGPVDLDSMNLNVTFDCRVTFLDVFDEDLDQSDNAWFLWYSGATQFVEKGSFHASFGEFSDIEIYAGTTDDIFHVAGMLLKSELAIDSGGGSNVLDTINFGGLNNAGKLDAIFPEPDIVSLTGPTGSWFVDLDDSADLIGDGDEDYFVSATSAGKGGRTIMTFPRGCNVNLIGDADDNDFTFGSGISGVVTQTHATLNGGAGNDTFSNTGKLEDWQGGGVILGGNGNDSLFLDDTDPDSSVFTYRFDDAGFSVDGRRPLAIDGTLEAIYLDQNAGFSTTTFLDRKPSNTALNVNAGDGNDFFVAGNGDIDSNGWRLTTVLGGAGSDRMTFDDQLDTDTDGSTSNYTLDNSSFTKGTSGFMYGGFENQTLNVANGVIPGRINSVPVVNINATSSLIGTTTINGGASRGAIVNIPNGFNGLSATLNINLHNGGSDTVTLDDRPFGTAATYNLTKTAITRPGWLINYSGVSAMTFTASEQADVVNIKGVPAGMTLTAVGAGNIDTMTLGNGDLSSDLLGPVSLNGGTANDSVIINNSTDSALANQTFAGTSLTEVLTHTFSSFEAGVTVNEGPGGTILAINSVFFSTNVVNGGSGNDSFTVGGGDIDSNIPISPSTAPALFINGQGGTDSIRFNDLNDTVATTDLNIFQRPNGVDQLRKEDGGAHFVSWSNIESVTFDANNAPQFGVSISTTIVTDLVTPLRINGNGGPDSIQVADASAPVVVHTGLGDLDNLSVNSDLDAILPTVVIDQTDDVENLSIFGGTLRVLPGAVLVKTQVNAGSSLDIFGVLDLAGGALLSRAGGPTPAILRTKLIAGRSGGGWAGTSPSGAINSSLAAATQTSDGVGYGLGSEVAPTSIGGFAIAPGDTLLRYALDGDADLSGGVNIGDFSRIAANFNGANKVWTTGDSNYDNATNIADFAPLAANFNQSLAAVLRRAASAQFAPLFGRRPITPVIDETNNDSGFEPAP